MSAWIHKALVIALIAFCFPSMADDKSEIRNVISNQVRALSDDNARAAFNYATPSIQARFVSADFFINMVKASYPALINPQKFEVRDVETSGRKGVARARVVTNDGKVFLSIYPMVQQADGEWRIDGCYMQPMQGQAL